MDGLMIKHVQTGSRLGTVVCTPNRGWKFYPMTIAHVPSRKFHETADDAIPNWVKRMGIYIEYPDFGS